VSELSLRHEAAIERATHGPGRPLGQKRRPQLKLALGFRDEQRRGAPVKTDYFIPQGDDRAVTKFVSVYGDRPRAVDIRLPGSLPGFLDIRHVAFAGGGSGEGGWLKAIGSHNFAAEGALGGPDLLTVFERVPSGEVDRHGNAEMTLAVEEHPITGVDDPLARSLEVYLQMTVSFGIPNVLGFGGLAQVRTRGKESMDTLWESAVDIYGQLGSYAMVALRPKLVLKASTMLTPSGVRAELFVLDLYLPESLDEVYERLERHHELVPSRASEARALMYAEPSGETSEPQANGVGADNAAAPSPAVSEAAHLSGESPSEPPEQPPPIAEADAPAETPFGPSDPPPSLKQAAEARFPSGKYGGKTLREVAGSDEGRRYLLWAAGTWKSPPDFAQALQLYAKGLSS
jgi:hypothetical protein